ncbi:DNA helicase, partial [Haematococcus lacustris]
REAVDTEDIPLATIVANFRDFITKAEPQWDTDKKNQLFYQNQLYHNKDRLNVDLEHLRAENPHLAVEVETKPTVMLPLFEQAAVEVLQKHYADTDELAPAELAAQGVQVMLYSSSPLTQSRTRSIRDLAAENVSQLVMHKATAMTIQCRSCKGVMSIACSAGMGGAMIPSYCNLNRNALPGTDKCEAQPFQVLSDRSKYVDQQTLKLQEKPEDVPTGEMPRTVSLVVDRHLVGRITPGTRINVVGIYSAFKAKAMDRGPAALQQPYIRVVALQEEAGDSHSRFNFRHGRRCSGACQEQGDIS